MVKAIHSNDGGLVKGPQQGTGSSQNCPADAVTSQLLARLHETGVECGLTGDRRRLTAGGASINVTVREALQSPMAMMRLANSLLLLLQDGVPVTLNLSALGPRLRSAEVLREFCDLLVSVLDAGGVCYAMPGLSVSARELDPRELVEVAAVLGAGPRYVGVEPDQLRQARGAARPIWDSLWRSRQAEVSLWPVYGSEVRAVCDLLGAERATTVLPGQGLRVPAGTAWLPMRMNLARFAAPGGDLDWLGLHRALRRMLEVADLLFDRLTWSLAVQRNDAWLNRRLALQLTGLGELVRARGLYPQQLEALRTLDRDIAKIAALLHQETRRLAQERGTLPALTANDPTGAWHDSQQRENWRRRWRQAVEHAAVRHRNLLVLSPYSLIATQDSSYRGSADLLPVLRHAQVIAFAEPPLCAGDLDDFCTFHSRASAVMSAGQSS